MNKTKTKLLGALVLFLALAWAPNTSAFNNPDEDDIFWDTLAAEVAQHHRPSPP